MRCSSAERPTRPTALRLTESATYPNGTLQLAYEPAGAPTYGTLA